MLSSTRACIKTDRLYVMYDTGETVPFLAEMAYQMRQGKDFRFIAIGSAINSLTVANCENNPELHAQIMARRIDLKKDIGVNDEIDPITWPREAKMSKEGIHKIRDFFKPTVVIVGTASRIQKQVLTHFPNAVKISFVDNFDYSKTTPSFATVELVQKTAEIVMCPSRHTTNLFVREDSGERKYVVVGSPTLETWMKQIQAASKNKACILEKLGFTHDKPIVAFMDAYDSNPAIDSTYSKIMSPLFEILSPYLQEKGYQVVIQPHPKIRAQKVTTPELLAVCDYVIGYNSSTIFSSLALGKKVIYLIPEVQNTKIFTHFSIDKGYANVIKFTDTACVPERLHSLLVAIKDTHSQNIFALEGFPSESIEKIDAVIDLGINKTS